MQSPENNPTPEQSTHKSRISRFTDFIRSKWHPKEVEIPKVETELPALPPVERSAESIRYGFKRLEYWVSPTGTIREWLRFNLWVAGMLAVPSLLVVPLLTYLLGSFASWTGFLVQIVANLIVFPMLAVVFIAIISGIVFVGRAFAGR